MKVIAFNGSPRATGNTHDLLRLALGELETQGIETELMHLGKGPVSGCTACYQCVKNQNRRCVIDGDFVNTAIAKMIEADGIIIGSPVYFSDVTTQVKALIDRSGTVLRRNGNLLQRKVGSAVLAVRRAGACHALASINYWFHINQMIVPGASYWNMGFGLNPGEAVNDEEGVKNMKVIGENVGWLLKKLQA